MIISYTINTLVNTDSLTPADLHTTIIGKITIPHNGENILAGEIQADYLDLESALENQIAMKDIFEAASQGDHDLMPYYHAIHISPEETDFEEEINPEFTEQAHGMNVLIIGKIEIDPAFEEVKTRLIAVWKTIQQFKHGCSLIMISPFPADTDGLSPQEIEAAIDKQILQYRRMGFSGPIRENILYMDLDLTQPNAAETGL